MKACPCYCKPVTNARYILRPAFLQPNNFYFRRIAVTWAYFVWGLCSAERAEDAEIGLCREDKRTRTLTRGYEFSVSDNCVQLAPQQD